MNDMCHMSCDEQLVNDVSHDRITKYFIWSRRAGKLFSHPYAFQHMPLQPGLLTKSN